MSKRFIFQSNQFGERKKPRLDVTVSDHNFPLSQNVGSNNDSNQANTWGDDNDDEILLLASQACEQAYGDNNINTLPDYSICMQPMSTSTQMFEPVPSTSKAFSFKKPSVPKLNKVNCDKIASPISRISSKGNDDVNISDDLILNDQIFQNQDPIHIYRQLVQLQEENSKLKSENGKLLEKCVTKEGEASILRSQLKNCQAAVDNARIEKIKAQEKAQLEWSEKLVAAQNQIHDIRTQLDFKNLEIISAKERCKMLESTKVNLTQVKLTGNDISVSQRYGHGAQNDEVKHKNRTKTASNAVQTDGRSHFLKLNTVIKSESLNLNEILSTMLEPTEEQCSILDFNDKLKSVDESQKCRMLYTFYQLPTTPQTNGHVRKARASLHVAYEHVTNIVAAARRNIDNYLKLVAVVKDALTDVESELETVSQRTTSAFHKDMDQRYMDATNRLDVITRIDLLSGRSIIKDEQAILARRIVVVLVYVLEDSKSSDIFDQLTKGDHCPINEVVQAIVRICCLLDDTCCALLYSGLLSSMIHLLDVISHADTETAVRSAVRARPMLFVSGQILHLLRNCDLKRLCPGVGNMKVDYDQGVLLYRKDSCTLQVLLKQIEAGVKCAAGAEPGARRALALAGDLVLLHAVRAAPGDDDDDECECHLVLLQVLVHALQVASDLLQSDAQAGEAVRGAALRVCRAGAGTLGGRATLGRLARLRYHRGLLQRLADVHPLGSLLTEAVGMFQAEEAPASYQRQAWLKSFQTFSLTD